MFGKSWPIWFMMWWVMWQWSAQSPGSSATNSMARVLPDGTSTVVSGHWAESGISPAVGLGDAELIAVDVDGVVVHGAQVAQADAHPVAGLATSGAVDGKALEFMVRTLKSVISLGLGRRVPGVDPPTR